MTALTLSANGDCCYTCNVFDLLVSIFRFLCFRGHDHALSQHCMPAQTRSPTTGISSPRPASSVASPAPAIQPRSGTPLPMPVVADATMTPKAVTPSVPPTAATLSEIPSTAIMEPTPSTILPPSSSPILAAVEANAPAVSTTVGPSSGTPVVGENAHGHQQFKRTCISVVGSSKRAF